MNDVKKFKSAFPEELPLVPLKDTVVFPQAILSIYVSEKQAKKAVLESWESHRMILAASLKNSKSSEVYELGSAAIIMRMRKTEDSRIKILIQGLSRASINKVTDKDYLRAHVSYHEEEKLPSSELSPEAEKDFKEIKQNLAQLTGKTKFFSSDFLLIMSGISDPGQICDLILSNLSTKSADLQKGLEALNIEARLKITCRLLRGELDISRLQGRIHTLIQNHLPKKDQKPGSFQYSQNMPNSGNKKEDISEYTRRIQDKKLPNHVEKEASKQLKRLEKMHSESSEASMLRSYLDCILELPWEDCSEDNLDIKHAENILNEDHHGLEKAKERILEFLAVKNLKPKDSSTPILCFSGPPGVGKTSLGKSIAKAMNRKYFRIALGGVKDEAEIRGHRRTYVGAMPGKIIQALKTCQTKNPVIVLDEIDKLGADFRGDPSSALLEVLDPEQNNTFKDHYLNINFDLSQVLFITTANLVQNIPPALKDRLELLPISGYTLGEKVHIAKNYMVKKELSQNGLSEDHVSFTEESLKTLVTSYTQESGLRNLKRELASICRKLAKNFVLGDKNRVNIDKQDVFDILGSPYFLPEEQIKEARVGLATGLAWTSAGGQILHVEAIRVKNSKGKLILTGKLGDVMKESAQAALSYVKSCSESLEIDPKWFDENEIHIHLPSGAIPKDGPSAGVTIASVLLSLVTKIPVKNTLAMTGEITLSGRVLPVGGIKEKVLAAFNHGIKEVILPFSNKKDLQEIPEEIQKQMNLILAKDLNDVFKSALLIPVQKSSVRNLLKDTLFKDAANS